MDRHDRFAQKRSVVDGEKEREMERKMKKRWLIVELYLGTVLGLGHSHQQLEDGLRLGHQGGDGMDDGGKLGLRSDT